MAMNGHGQPPLQLSTRPFLPTYFTLPYAAIILVCGHDSLDTEIFLPLHHY